MTKSVPVSSTRVLADGTYATETAYSQNATSSASQLAHLEAVKAAAKPPLRALILGGDFYTATVLAATLTKLVMRLKEVGGDARAVNELRAEVRFSSFSSSSIELKTNLVLSLHRSACSS